jgi:branched-chain amino acid transport system permease protein
MSSALLALQVLNGLQLGLILFLIAAGLTLVFGVMDFINLAHGVQYMLGAYLMAMFTAATGDFLIGLALALPSALAVGLLLEFAVFRHLYDRPHLDQVLATFGIILFLNQAVKFVWGAAPLQVPVPDVLSGSIQLTETLVYPVYRLTLIGVGAMLAGFAGIMVAPILSVEPGMGDNILILAFVVIVIGGIGSIRGAFIAALLIGLVDTLGRSFMVDVLRLVTSSGTARTVGPALASMLIYLLMATILFVRPAGLFPVKGR